MLNLLYIFWPRDVRKNPRIGGLYFFCNQAACDEFSMESLQSSIPKAMILKVAEKKNETIISPQRCPRRRFFRNHIYVLLKLSSTCWTWQRSLFGIHWGGWNFNLLHYLGQGLAEGMPNGHGIVRAGSIFKTSRAARSKTTQYGFVWKCCVPLNPMVLLIIIPIKWL